VLVHNGVVVVKLGSNALVDGHGRLDVAFLGSIASQLAALRAQGRRPVLVSSGAVASGMGILGLSSRPAGISERQALAAIGQATLAQRWQSALAEVGLTAAQVLLTYDDFTVRSRYLNLTAAFNALFAYQVVPVINENDTVAVEELTVGDNDRLSALVASQLEAERLVLLTDIDGVYDADPRTHAGARLIAEIPVVTAAMLASAGGASARGRGGMRSKLEAARLASSAGILTHIASARVPEVVVRLVAGEAIGTRLPPHQGGERPDGRRRWLAVARKVRGQLHVDAGAVAALQGRGRSLLPAGITRVEGGFARGDTVAILSPQGEEIARGLASLSSQELGQVLGRRLDAAAGVLGYALPKAAVHRDNLLLIGGAR
jgi:glutamate 5-kinase